MKTVLNKYLRGEGVAPRRCEQAVGGQECVAELSVQTASAEHFLCVHHAARLLKEKPELLAQAVVETFLATK